ncbi:MAG: nuclear transport factor 2 family protein [Ardenticatenales bacterium]
MGSIVSDSVDQYFARLTGPDAAAFAGLFAPEAEVEDPVGSPPLLGPGGMTIFHQRLHKAWRSLVMTPVVRYERGKSAAVQWTANGMSTGGSAIAFEGINVFEVRDDGKIVRLGAYWDFESVIAQF